MKLRCARTLSLVSTLFAVGCGAVPPEDVPGDVLADIGETTQALGKMSTIWSGPDKDSELHHGQELVVFGRKRFKDGCGLVSAVRNDTGEETITPFPSCLTYATAAVSDSEVFVGHDKPVGISKVGPSGMTSVTTPVVFPQGRMLLDATYVYWSDGTGINRARRSGGIALAVKLGVGKYLLGMDGSTLYYQQAASTAGMWDLFGIPSGGGTATKLATETGAFYYFSFDASHFYWLSDSNATGFHQMRRVSKGGGTPSTVMQSTDKDYGSPLSNGSMLYWIEERPDSTIVLRRKNLSNGNVVTGPDTFDSMPFSMKLTSSFLSAVELGSPGHLVKKGPL